MFFQSSFILHMTFDAKMLVWFDIYGHLLYTVIFSCVSKFLGREYPTFHDIN